MVGRQILGALASRNDFKSGRARPVDHFANQCRLVTVRERIDDARFCGAFGQQRACQRVGLDIHHHDVFFVFATRQYVRDTRERAAGRIDNDFNMPIADERLSVVRDVRGPADVSLLEVLRSKLFILPTDASQRFAGARRIEICDTQQMYSGCTRNLREIH